MEENVIIMEDEAQEALNDFETTVNDVVVLDALKAYLKSIGNHPRLNFEQEKELSARALNGDQGAINELVRCNLLLVVPIAKRYYGCGLPLLDIIQEGNLGLITAAKKYDGTKGWRFSTYATYWVRQSISRALGDQSRTIRIPANMVELLGKVRKATNELTIKFKRQPTDEEIAKYLDEDLDKIQTVLDVSQAVSSLDLSVDEDGETSVGDLVADDRVESGYANLVKEANKQIVDDVLGTLPAREAEILRMRFGINQEKAMTLEEVGSHYGITKERIRQIENKAIRKLRHPARARMLKEAMV